ncbi:hypothetical protein HYT51_00735 [Candidatus Woesearchaeota archaeon]|nr:hypothetical protein [Candidatus Woesearchaeota archaeon]
MVEFHFMDSLTDYADPLWNELSKGAKIKRATGLILTTSLFTGSLLYLGIYAVNKTERYRVIYNQTLKTVDYNKDGQVSNEEWLHAYLKADIIPKQPNRLEISELERIIKSNREE